MTIPTTGTAQASPTNGDFVTVDEVSTWYRTCMASHKLHILHLVKHLSEEVAFFVETWRFRPERGNIKERIREVDDFYFDVVQNTNRFFDMIANVEPNTESAPTFTRAIDRMKKMGFALTDPVSGAERRRAVQERAPEVAQNPPRTSASTMEGGSSLPAAAVAGPSNTHAPKCLCSICRRVIPLVVEPGSEYSIFGNPGEPPSTQAGPLGSSANIQTETLENDIMDVELEPVHLPTLKSKSRRLEKQKENLKEREGGQHTGRGSGKGKETDEAAPTRIRGSSTRESYEKGKSKSKDVPVRVTRSAAGKNKTEGSLDDESNKPHKPKEGNSRNTKRPREEDEEREPVVRQAKRQSKRRKVT